MPNDVLVKVSKVLDKGQVQIPPEMREKLGLKPGTKVIVYATEDGVVLRKAELFFERETPGGLLSRIRGIFSKIPIRDIEE
jgi:AbrB family looped-hinge helix DNA binding protein